jgi:hypothetical protein
MGESMMLPIAVAQAEYHPYQIPSYSNFNGSGNRPWMAGKISVGGAWGGSMASQLASGNLLTNGVLESAMYPGDGVAVAGLVMLFDFTLFGTVLITEITQYMSGSTSASGLWKCQGYNTSWVDIGAPFTLSASAVNVISLAGNETGYAYYQFLGISGVTSWNDYWQELTFKIGNLL